MIRIPKPRMLTLTVGTEQVKGRWYLDGDPSIKKDSDIPIGKPESRPYFWLQEDEPVKAWRCGCRFEADHHATDSTYGGAALILCRAHRAVWEAFDKTRHSGYVDQVEGQ